MSLVVFMEAFTFGQLGYVFYTENRMYREEMGMREFTNEAGASLPFMLSK